MYSVQTLIFAVFGIIFAIYLYSVVEHDDGVGKVCLILLGCLGVTLPFVLLNFNFEVNQKRDEEEEGLRSITRSIEKLMKDTHDNNATLYLLQSLKKELVKTRPPNVNLESKNQAKGENIARLRSIRLDQMRLGIVQCVYKILQSCELMEDKRVIVSLEIIALLFEDELVRNEAFRDEEYARFCVDEHCQFILRLLPVGLMHGNMMRNTLIIKVITVLTLMTINDPVTQDRFADRGMIYWILGSCFQHFNGEDKTIVNVGIYGLLALIKDNPGNKSKLFRHQFIHTIEQLLHQFMTSSNVCTNAISILFILIEPDTRQKYSTQQLRQDILQSNLMNLLLEIKQKTDDDELKSGIQTILNYISKDLA